MAVLQYLLSSFACSFIVTLLLLSLFVLLFRLKDGKRNVCIIVLGDIGRSPRMQYHAKSFSEVNLNVNIVGFRGSSPLTELLEKKNIKFSYISNPPNKPKMIPGSLFYLFKAVYQWIQLFLFLLFVVDKPHYFFLQNPPAIPTLSVVWIVSLLKGSEVVIDWHNYAYTILAMNLKREDHILVRFSKWYEGFFGSLADANICVTKAMKNHLLVKWGVKASVLYDRPPERFKQTSIEEKHELFLKLYHEGYTCFSEDKGESTIFTSSDNEKVVAKRDSPALIISSTSWTEDEDFSILLNALESYDERKKESELLPDLMCIITGKGPQKEYYKSVIKEKEFKYVQIVTPWLSTDDYPKIIGSGDLGVCLHTSSSGLDLPMKVVDMFGCGLPVCAVNFSCLHELVKHNKNGLVFKTSGELCSQMMELLTAFPNGCDKLISFRANLSSFQEQRWHKNWLEVMSSVVP